MKKSYQSYPIIRPVVFLIVGVILGEYLNLPVFVAISILGVCVSLYVGFYFLKIRYHIQLFIVLVTFFSLGVTLISVHQPPKNHLNYFKDSILTYKGKIDSEITENVHVYKLVLAVTHVRTDDGWTNVEGKVLLSIAKHDSIQLDFQFGDELLIKGSPMQVNPPTNPNTFDYQAYLKYQYIWHQDFVQFYEVLYQANQELSFWETLRRQAIILRDWSDHQLKQNLNNSQSHAVASALFLGIRDGLDNDLKNAYASAGATHVLAVSGLHVGMLVWIFGLSFKFLQKRKYGKILFSVLLLLLLIGYVLLTGMSPSVLRAALMFGVVQLGLVFRKRCNIFNTIALSAFILLVYNPYLLFQVGFQLSYLAVLGIVILQPKLEKAFYTFPPKSYRSWWQHVLKFFQDIFTVSIAAQLATAPISLYYFHQFPTYFLFSGLIVIPAAYVIWCGSLLTIVSSALVPIFGKGVGFLLSWFVFGVNYLIKGMDGFWLALIEPIRMTAIDTILLYASVACIYAFIFSPKRIWVIGFCSIACLFFSSRMYWIAIFDRQERMVFYQVRKGFAASIQQGNQAILLVDSMLFYDKRSQDFIFKNDLLANGVKQQMLFRIDSIMPDEVGFLHVREWQGGKLIQWNGKSYLFWDKPIRFTPTLSDIEAICVNNNPFYDLKQLDSLETKQLIFSSTNYPSRVKKWAKDRYENHKPYAYLKNGAWVRFY